MEPWTGPREGEVDACGEWLGALPIPEARWPYGPPPAHDEHCLLRDGGRYCDCEASDESSIHLSDETGRRSRPRSLGACRCRIAVHS